MNRNVKNNSLTRVEVEKHPSRKLENSVRPYCADQALDDRWGWWMGGGSGTPRMCPLIIFVWHAGPLLAPSFRKHQAQAKHIGWMA